MFCNFWWLLPFFKIPCLWQHYFTLKQETRNQFSASEFLPKKSFYKICDILKNCLFKICKSVSLTFEVLTNTYDFLWFCYVYTLNFSLGAWVPFSSVSVGNINLTLLFFHSFFLISTHKLQAGAVCVWQKFIVLLNPWQGSAVRLKHYFSYIHVFFRSDDRTVT